MSNQKYRSLKPTASHWLLLPFVLALSVVPLIIRYYNFENKLSDQYWRGGNATTTEMFLHYKSVAFVVLSAVMLLILIIYRLESGRAIGHHVNFGPLYVYLFFVTLSAIFTKHPYFVLHGIDNHFESVFVQLGYCVMVFYGAYFVDSEKNLKWMLKGWLIGTLVLVAIGVGQAFKLDIFLSDFIGYLILPRKFWGEKVSLSFDLGRVYLTLYNPNYVGYFASLTTPIFTLLCIFSKKWWQKVLYGITVAGILICLFGSQARNGIVALLVSFIVLIVAFRKHVLKYWPFFIGAVCVFIITFFGINALRHNALLDLVKRTFTITDAASKYKLQAIDTLEDCVTVKYRGNVCQIRTEITEEGTVFTFMDDKQQYLEYTPYTIDEDTIVLYLNDIRFPFIVQLLNIEDTLAFQLVTEEDLDTAWVFTNNLAEPGYFYLNPLYKWVKLETAKSAVFTNLPHLASNRGYIWARTIPMLKDNLILGTGPDTFVMTFPHNDYVASTQAGYYGSLISKPHNLYLQMGVQTGVISMIAFIVFYLMYLVFTVKLYWKHPLDNYVSQVGVGICASTTGYMASALTNDSTMTYSLVFWGLMGVGIAVNHLVKKELALSTQKDTEQDTEQTKKENRGKRL